MIYSLTGELTYIGDQFLVIDCGGVGLNALHRFPQLQPPAE